MWLLCERELRLCCVIVLIFLPFWKERGVHG